MFRSFSKLAPRRFAQARRASAAVEFALCGTALFAFLLGIVNLGYLGLVVGAVQRGVQGSARQAAAAAAANLASGTTPTCPSTAMIQGYFNHFASPPLPANSAGLNPVWGAGSAGLYVAVGDTYTWQPIGFSAFTNGFTLRYVSSAYVIGSNSSTTC